MKTESISTRDSRHLKAAPKRTEQYLRNEITKNMKPDSLGNIIKNYDNKYNSHNPYKIHMQPVSILNSNTE